MATENIFKKAKAYVKLHPRTSFQDAIQKVKGKKTVSGVRKKVSGTKRVASPAKRIAAPKAVTGKKRSVGKIGAVSHAKKLMNDIAKMEKDRAKETSREMRDIYALAINKKHKDLDRVKRSL